MSLSVTKESEFYEVVNAFPILKELLKDLSIDEKDIKEGESIGEFFNKMHISEDEKSLIMRRIKRNINYFMKHGELEPKEHKVKIIHEEIPFVDI